MSAITIAGGSEPKLPPNRKAEPTPVADAIHAAGRALRSLRSSSSVQFDTPTRERLAQAGRGVVYGSAVRSVEIVRNDLVQVEQIRVPRVRVDEDPFTRLANRGQLAPDNEDVNRWLRTAGERYRALHHAAGRETLQGQDPTKGFSTTARGQSEGQDRMLDAWSAWFAANEAMALHMRRAVDDVVLYGLKLDEVGGRLSGYTDRACRKAIALTFLRFGLKDLDQHFADVDRSGAAP